MNTGNYTSHVQWHPEDALYHCIGCGAKGKERSFVKQHKDCEKLLTPEQANELSKNRQRFLGVR